MLRPVFLAATLALAPALALAGSTSETLEHHGDLTLVHVAEFDASVEQLWDAFTTAEGYMAWAAPVAEVDLRTGGTIRSHYTPGAAVGDEGTVTLHLLQVVPRRLLLMQAEPAPNWPASMQEDADRFMNLVVFEPTADGGSKVTSYGLGYRDNEEYRGLLAFFDQANQGLYAKLAEYLEEE